MENNQIQQMTDAVSTDALKENNTAWNLKRKLPCQP
jgi:hypothetical protein